MARAFEQCVNWARRLKFSHSDLNAVPFRSSVVFGVKTSRIWPLILITIALAISAFVRTLRAEAERSAGAVHSLDVAGGRR